MQTITVDSVTPRDGKRPWKIQSNGTEYVTWEDDQGKMLENLRGQQVQVDVEVRRRGNYVDQVIREVKTQEWGGPPLREGEPNVNQGKQVVIIRQNAWSQTNDIYALALAFIQAANMTPTPDNMESIAGELWPGMSRMAYKIEHTIRSYWFPAGEEEIPF